ncbi:DNA repair protein RecN [Brevirhabdus pacifica]|uniref:DNA repair protein RecN n=2 Tax=Brevirhabdus pacifica TaxID=1267768 RepID=A0A1U7DKR9_9RHOB|nr:DNA repair protein RecN [Brevirhabdus pacifica]APX90571.1 DNA repair protein RecN [Brevirhabdus pacifica]OWU78431.1 DNA recombination protein RecN [Loktanella sp. 22II-4b]PJJ85298.1 DNA replication and repair protein RecN [Brevirhabdus pacifica]
MLRSLDIHDMLIIDRLELAFQPGLNVLTGETGAGKSILLDCLGFVLGWRGRAELVRQGAQQGEVVAVFDLPPGHAAREILAEAGLPDEEPELILRRVNGRDGRKTAWVNDRRTSGEVLRRLSETLVELHGQHDDRGLLNPRGHRRLLDQFGDLEEMVGATRKAWRGLASAREALEAAEKAIAALRQEEDYLRHAVEELDKLDPQPGEDAELDTARRRMQAAGRIREDVVRAHHALGSDGVETVVLDALRWLEGAQSRAAASADKGADGGPDASADDGAEGAGDPAMTLDAPIEALGRLLAELGEAQQGVKDALRDLSFDDQELERVEERLFALRGLARKHDVTPDQLGDFAETLRQRLAALDAGGADLERLRAALDEARQAYDAAAATLGKARRSAAATLDAAMAAELAPLKMERALFATEITEDEPGPEGRDLVTFSVATNPGAPAGPLNRIASGGELSRFLLALKVCLTTGVSGLTMIFDEIDRGVGGATADAVGRRLAALSQDAQVLVVTHSPQVAALGAHHWRVEKTVADEVTTSTVVPLAPETRVDEIARMLAGDTVTEAARDAARALLRA